MTAVRRRGPVSQLSDQDVRNILDARERGESLREISERYPVSHEMIRQVAARRLLRHVDPDRGPAQVPPMVRRPAPTGLSQDFIENLAKDLADQAARPERTEYDEGEAVWSQLDSTLQGYWREYAAEVTAMVTKELRLT